MKKQKQPSFSKKIYDVVRKIPCGKTMTYAEVAKKAGRPRAVRAVGYWMSKNYDPKIPCHRVVRSDGKVGNYNRGGSKKKLELLKEEGAL
jgi:methylated-DNA-[protein]-cysteine S-methyltransferase